MIVMGRLRFRHPMEVDRLKFALVFLATPWLIFTLKIYQEARL